MAIIDRLFGRKPENPKEAAPAAAARVPMPWSLIVHDGGDVCISVRQLDRPVASFAVVFNPEFYDEALGTSPLRLVAAHRDGTATELDLAVIDAVPGRETAQIEAMGRIARAPSVLLCETDGVGIANIHHAPVYIDEVVQAPSPRKPGPDARTYAATVLNVLDAGNALHEWKGLVRLRAGEFEVGEVFMTLYPAPVLQQGARTTVTGTLRAEGGRTSMQSCTDAVMTEMVRLTGFSAPFRLEMELGGVGAEGRSAAREIAISTIAAMSAAGCRAHGYMEGTLAPYVRMLGNPFDREAAANVERFAVRLDETESGAKGYFAGEDIVHPDRPVPVTWQVLIGPGDAFSFYIDSTSPTRPMDAKVLVHDRTLLGRYGPASPVGILLTFENGSKRRLLVGPLDEDTLSEIRERDAIRVVELHDDEPIQDYEARVHVQNPEASHVPRV